MRTAIATVSLSGTLPEKLSAIAAAGFKGVEIFENDLISFHGTPADVRAMCADLGLGISTFQPFRDFEGMPPEKRSRVFDRAERKFELMGELGCDLLLVCSNVSPESLPGIDRAAADFHELGERAARHGIRLGFEALAWGRHIHDYRDAWEVVRRANHPDVGLIIDSFHVLSRGTELKSLGAIPGDRLFLVHIADAPKLEMDYLSWSRHWRCLPGQGDLDIGGFMKAVETTGFNGLLSLEIFNDRFRAGSARSVAVDGQRSLVNMLDTLSRDTGKRIYGQTPMPAPSACHGIAFIEFAVHENEVPQFTTLLAGLGFAQTGRHRSKDVRLFAQGDIRIVVNSDKEGFAYSYNMTHGTSVCALALSVDDAGVVIERAQALRDEPFKQAVGPGELNIPAVRGLGGSLVYFVDEKSSLGRWWEVDFDHTDAVQAGVGLMRTDHVSQSMQYEEMLTWLLFYMALLDASKTPTQAVVDPGGVVQSQVIESGKGALRLILNSSQSHRTMSGRFLNDFFGSGVQHIAFETADIFATVDRLKANGVALLPIPDNYYDDLEARIDLPQDVLDRLRASGILYDRDGDGEFFQVYTATLEGGLFFEIVQRSGYQGYGAANAGVRLAAQTRMASSPALPKV